jgi:hypothetical protein
MMDVVKVAITKFADFRLTKTGTRCKIYDVVAVVVKCDGCCRWWCDFFTLQTDE